jgi:hypothetical protein
MSNLPAPGTLPRYAELSDDELFELLRFYAGKVAYKSGPPVTKAELDRLRNLAEIAMTRGLNGRDFE